MIMIVNIFFIVSIIIMIPFLIRFWLIEDFLQLDKEYDIFLTECYKNKSESKCAACKEHSYGKYCDCQNINSAKEMQ